MRLDDWFLTAAERGNDDTRLDSRHRDGEAWTTGNEVEVRIDGESYFGRLEGVLASLGPGDLLMFTDWEGHADERLSGPGSELGRRLAGLPGAGVGVFGLLWRSHPRQAHFSEQDSLHIAREINGAGGSLMLDERVRRAGSHHQKLVVAWRAETRGGPVAFAGGIDLCHGRHDGSDHRGDPQAVRLDRRYGERPPWHDLQVELRGPAVADLSWSFRERWSDPAPLDHRNPLRALLRHVARQPRHPPVLPSEPPAPAGAGPHAIQVLRTYPAKRPPYDFARRGERSVARAYLKALGRARRLVYIEDQYLWSEDAGAALARALRAHPELLVVVVVPRFPDRDGALSGASAQFARRRVVKALEDAGGERFAIYDLENEEGVPVYVHAKVCVIDDVWLEVGSDNLNRRSWTHDSEIACAFLDERLDERIPPDPGGLGDGARRLARETRLALWREHLGRRPGDDDDLVDPAQGFAALADGAAALDSWRQAGCAGTRPPGRLRRHQMADVPISRRLLAAAMYHTVLDPDGRPWAERRRDRC